MTDSSGNLSSSASYDSFGNSSNNLTTRYQYTGREFDNFTGLQYSRARWYDANLGRFISEDPIGFVGGINLFAYVKNNPLFYKDPRGHNACVAAYAATGSVIGAVIGGGVGLVGVVGGGVAVVVTEPAGLYLGAAGGGLIGATVGSLVCGTPPFPNQSDSLPRVSPQPYPKEGDKTTCDSKPRPIPLREPTPRKWDDEGNKCMDAWSRCMIWAGNDANRVISCSKALLGCRKNRPFYFPHGEWVF